MSLLITINVTHSVLRFDVFYQSAPDQNYAKKQLSLSGVRPLLMGWNYWIIYFLHNWYAKALFSYVA